MKEIRARESGHSLREKHLPSKLPQVLPQYVESDTQNREDDNLPEVVLEEDKGAYDRQSDIGTDYEPG